MWPWRRNSHSCLGRLWGGAESSGGLQLSEPNSIVTGVSKIDRIKCVAELLDNEEFDGFLLVKIVLQARLDLDFVVQH